MLPRLFWSSYPRDHLHLHPFPTRRSSDLSSETIWTSRMSGTECSTLGCSPSSAATIALETRFRSEEHTSELQSRGQLVCRPLLDKKKATSRPPTIRSGTGGRQ